MPDHDPLDDAIDRAVSEMMAVEPRSGFRRRFEARLAMPPRPTMWPRVVLAGCALAVLALFLLPRATVMPIDPRPDAALRTAERLAEPVAAPTPPPAAIVDRAAPDRPTRVTPRRGAGSAAGRPRDRGVRAASLPPADPDAMPRDPQADSAHAAIVGGATAIGALTIQPLMIAPLAVPPLVVSTMSPMPPMVPLVERR